VIAATIVGAPNIAAIPAATPIIKPQETLPVKKPMPTDIIAKAAKAFPAFPVIILSTLHIVPTSAFLLASGATNVPCVVFKSKFDETAAAEAEAEAEAVPVPVPVVVCAFASKIKD